MSNAGFGFTPVADHDTQEYWNGCKNRELLVRRCECCKTYRIPPGPGCPNCGSMKSSWVKIQGKGEIYTYTVVHRAQVPYNMIVVSLLEADGVHMVSNLVDCKNEDIKIGMPVEVVFEEIGGDMVLPKFRPVRTGS